MKVAIIHLRLLLKGGLETRLFNYLEFLEQKGFDVTLITSKIDPQIKISERIRIAHLNLSNIPKPLRMYFFNKKLKKYMARHHFDFSLSLGRTAWQDAVLCPGNHLGYLRAMKKILISPIDLMNIYLDKITFENCEIILAASGMMKDELVRFYKVPSDKINILYPPLNISKFNRNLYPHIAELRKKYGFSSDKRSFLFVSSSHKIKNIKLLLRLFESLQEEPIELIVAGNPVETNLSNVISLGFIKETNELMTAADLLIHPSKYEPFGQVISESLQCGTPVIISSMVGAKELVTEKEGIIVQDFSLSSWQLAVRQALTTEFSIQPDFAQHHKITLNDHMAQILDLID